MTDKIDGIILHTDGSCVPNPGDAGWGFHGYAYRNELPKKGSGNQFYYVTNLGYVEKTMLDAHRKGENPYVNLDESKLKEGTIGILDEHMESVEVTPLYYVDHFGPLGTSTNNGAEITALIKALEYCVKENIKTIRILADSEYTIDGFNKILALWAKNHWCRRDGTEIKNKELWQDMWKLKNEMKDYDIKLSWLPGHSIFLGNQLADTMANLGKNMTLAGLKSGMETKSEAQGYWRATEVDKHPLIVHQKLFFNGDISFHEPGRYYMGAVNKDLGLLGKRLSDTSYSVIQTKVPVDSIEDLVIHHCKNGGNQNETVIAHLGTFFKPDVFRQFTEFGTFAIHSPNHYNNNLITVDKQVVTEVIDPPKKSLDAILAMNNIATWLTDWLEGKPAAKRFVETDLTPHLYETSVAKKKNKDVTVTKLLATIKSGVASIEVNANYRDAAGVEVVLPTILSFGIDIADRNGLKRIEDTSPKVTLLSWEESPGIFRYFTVIQAEDDIGAYCGYYSNTRLNKPSKKKT
jgi:ribonuclease HI